MIKDCITYLNAKLETLGYFNNILCLADKIWKENIEFPAIYTANGEYKRIDLDKHGSVTYWRKRGEVTITEQDNVTQSKSTQYETVIPLKLVCFRKRDVYANDQYFADNLALEIMSYLTTNNSALKSAMKAKKVSVIAGGYNTDSKSLWEDEFTEVDFAARYTHTFFSIDFDLKIVTNNQCYSDICNDAFVSFGVTIYDADGAVVAVVPCGGTYTETAATCEGDISVYLDGMFQQTITTTDYATETITINLI